MDNGDDADEAIYRLLERALASVPPAARKSSMIVNVPLNLEQVEELMKLLVGFNPLLELRCDCPRARIEQALEDDGCGAATCPYRFGA